jgi:hypothetical protein
MSFFKKLGKDINQGFKKVGSGLKATFKKGGYIDQGLGKVGDVAKQVGKFAGKAGGVLSEIAPALAAVPGIGPELAIGAAGLGKFAQKVGGAAGKVSAGVDKASNLKKELVKGATRGLAGVKPAIAPTLEKPQPEEDMIGLANPAFDFQ